MIEFSSAFGERISGFLNYRIARGFKLETYIRHFIKFDRWCQNKQPEQQELTQELVHKWINASEDSASEIKHRVTAMRLFGRYLCAIGENAYILPEKYISCGSKFTPHIFTGAELTALFAALDSLPPTETEPFLHEIAPIMFRLIYTCGLRPNEGRELLRENVDLDTGKILIAHTKRNKERFVVMSDDMADLARSYERQRIIFGAGNPFFFPSAHGGALSANTVYAALNKAWSNSKLDGKFPRSIRVYDLRHQFASACLNRWLDSGENLMAMLPFLRSYMGHQTLSQTAYYIHVLPESIIKCSAIDWDKFNEMFPEVAE